jgi:transketolase N-terminal domain/subunit
MASLATFYQDLALAGVQTDSTRLDITSAEATTYTQAITTFSLGNKLTPSVGAPAAGTPSGRQVTVAAITGGSVTASGTAAFWALTNVVGTRLIATGSLSVSQAVTSGNTFSLAAFTIVLPNAISQ